MNRRKFLMAAGAAALVAGPLRADGIQDAIVRQLSAQGYSKVKISKTLLGRLRFVATSQEYRREIIVNSRTGEILRDYTESLSGGAATPKITSQNNVDDGGNASGNDDHDDGSHDDDSPEDDREDDDNQDDDNQDDDDSEDDPEDDSREDDHSDEDNEHDEEDDA